MVRDAEIIRVDARQIRNLLIRAGVFIVVLGISVSFSRIAAGGQLGADDLGARFELHTENSLSAWFSSLLLLASSPLFALFAIRSRGQRQGRNTLAWSGLAVLMLAMSLDEMASFHEHAGVVFDIRVAGFHGGYSWVAIGFAFVLVFGLVYAPFVRRLAAELRRDLIIGAAVFFGGAVGVETLNAYTASTDGTDATYRYVAQTAVEEGMEMLGAILVIYALLAHLQRNDWSVTFRFRASHAADESRSSI